MCIRDRQGFALPLTIFVLTLITIMLAAIFVRVKIDRRIAESSGDIVNAGAVAASGLQRYFAHYDSSTGRPLDGDSLRINVVGGYADVVARVVRQPADTTDGILYIVRSRGRLIKPTQGPEPQAVQTVAQFAQWQFGSMTVHGAFAAINDFSCPSGGCDGTFSLVGYDECGMASSVYGLRTPNGPTTGSGNIQPALLEGPAASTFAAPSFLGIDWATVIGGGLEPDYASLTNLSTWSMYLLTGNRTMTDVVGNGLLMVTGDLTISGQYLNWQGVVLVGGKIDFEADTTYIRGAVVSGINYQTGPNPSLGSWGPDSTHIDIQYNSCHVRSALTSLTGFAPISSAWMDNWATY
ncbi:MAG: hypothetical protein PVH40_00270 [Gemmatimonadales bacterium]|jgi:hypothetical protein